ncbi:MAG: WbqC family protein [Planctomycetes bacterium]|nr:WbqC family protein [Planctomycetota bacterium]
MLLTGHQPNYLPYAGFFDKVARADKLVIVDNVQFVKRGPFGWIHRNRIRASGADGWDWLTVPVLTKGKFTQTIRETAIDNSLPWPRKHWKTIEWNYRAAPHFADYAPELRAVYEKKWEWLCELNVELVRVILRWLRLDKPLCLSSEIGAEGKAGDLVVDLCRKTGADAYLSGVHGRDYLDLPSFERAGIRLEFQEYRAAEYPQCFSGPFVPNLSVVDLIFNCGPRSLEVVTAGR